MNGEKLMEIRDELTLQVHSWMQHVRDIPAENLPELAKLLRDTEVELLRLKREQ